MLDFLASVAVDGVGVLVQAEFVKQGNQSKRLHLRTPNQKWGFRNFQICQPSPCVGVVVEFEVPKILIVAALSLSLGPTTTTTTLDRSSLHRGRNIWLFIVFEATGALF